MSKISILTPTIGRETLSRTINSVLAQTHQDWELLIIPNSMDNHGRDVLTAIPLDPRIRVLKYQGHRKDSGTFARTVGLHVAEGDYICTLDDDDFWEPTFLETLHDYLEKNTEVGLVYCKTILHDRLDNNVKYGIWQTAYDQRLLRQAGYILSSSIMFRRNIALDYNFRGGYNSDWNFYIDMSQRNVVFATIPDVLAHLMIDAGVWSQWGGQLEPL